MFVSKLQLFGYWDLGYDLKNFFRSAFTQKGCSFLLLESECKCMI